MGMECSMCTIFGCQGTKAMRWEGLQATLAMECSQGQLHHVCVPKPGLALDSLWDCCYCKPYSPWSVQCVPFSDARVPRQYDGKGKAILLLGRLLSHCLMLLALHNPELWVVGE